MSIVLVKRVSVPALDVLKNQSVMPLYAVKITGLGIYPMSEDLRINFKKENGSFYFSEMCPVIILKEGDHYRFNLQKPLEVPANRNIYFDLENLSGASIQADVVFFGEPAGAENV